MGFEKVEIVIPWKLHSYPVSQNVEIAFFCAISSKLHSIHQYENVEIVKPSKLCSTFEVQNVEILIPLKLLGFELTPKVEITKALKLHHKFFVARSARPLKLYSVEISAVL